MIIMKKINYPKLITSIIICQLAGAIGSIFTSSSITSWYTTLEKPFFNPPNWIFGPVWTLLYTLMGISAGLIWRSEAVQSLKNKALGIFAAQLVVNGLWSILFFGLESPLMAFIDIILLLGLIA